MQLHPSQISPGENFDIFYFLHNPTDSTTYYVQAIIYDVRTGAILATVNLDQSPNNSHLFAKVVQSPADSTGNGRNIVAIASLYTDSGYTSKSTDYEEQEQYFLVKAELPFLGMGGGIDYRELRDIVKEEVAKGIASIEKAEAAELPEMPFDALFGAIGALQREINRIPKEADDTAILAALTDIKRAISALPEPREANLIPLAKQLNQVISDLADMRTEDAFDDEQLTIKIAELVSTVQAAKADLAKEIGDLTIQNQEVIIPVSRLFDRKKEENKPEPFDVRALMNT